MIVQGHFLAFLDSDADCLNVLLCWGGFYESVKVMIESRTDFFALEGLEDALKRAGVVLVSLFLDHLL